ncbi:MAG: FAD-dependent oxidoreductase [Bacteroides sp.]|nr:FAD-dependent oxidoreductase [Eubacterium sp.]MCM1418340.1 FAD-dependent oxidoreductase [Roseburia sp.]MCM1462822.1 FAD-dependent oxidoreductase [Bacteroides sp.]
MRKYVIIGNSAAAVGTVEGIRSVDPDGEITLIADEPHHTYSRPLISYLLLGKTDEKRMLYRGKDFYKKNKVTPILGKRVTGIDPAKKTVTLDGGETLGYEKLMNATGSKPFVPPTKGYDTVKNSFTFMTLDSAKAVGKKLKPDSRVLIVGAGLIGLKAAEAVAATAKELTVIDLADRILPSILDLDAGKIMQKHIEEKGTRILLGTSVERYEGNVAHLKNGETIDFDILITAVGVRPNIELVRDAGGKVGRGIVTDQTQLTSLPDVYAAGDCTESYDLSSGETKILALLPNAYMQGEVAGKNMAGGEAAYDKAIPMNAIGFYGLHIITAGSYNDDDAYTVKDGENYKRLFFREGRLVGFILMGKEIARAGIYTSLIRERIVVETVDLPLLKEKPQLLLFGKDVRKQKLSNHA